MSDGVPDLPAPVRRAAEGRPAERHCARVRDRIALPPELAFLRRHGFEDGGLAEAARLAVLWGVQGDEALLVSHRASEDAYYRALAAETALPFLGDEGWRIDPQARFPEAVLSGVAPLARGSGGGFRFVLAPRGRVLLDVLARARSAPAGLAITNPARLRRAVFAARGGAIARFAAENLVRSRPDESFYGALTFGQVWAVLGFGIASGVGTALVAGTLWRTLAVLVSLPFIGMSGIKLAATLEPASTEPARRAPRRPDAGLPVYTVLVPLYRETRVLARLVRALAALDYPPAKLDAKLLLEEGDDETASALASLRLPGFVEVLVVPEGRPRTKPRALNVGLALARGEYTVVFDAEDVPDPGQLRLALSTFAEAEGDVACLQARLVIDNTRDGWLTRFFTAEYAALFDVVNPALARFDLPVPLGGTSNHFRTAVLKGLGGWDPWNVTEDADLAVRLAAAGYRVADLPSATLEEAPRRLHPWLMQRTRWMKGFVQVTITHSRRPARNLSRLGLVRLLGAAAVTSGAVATALVYPVFLALVGWSALDGTLLAGEGATDTLQSGLALTTLGAGAGAMVLPALVGLRRRGLLHLWPCALMMPVYGLLVSLAAWRGLVELLRDPDRWNKTEHGLARTSRAAEVAPGTGRVRSLAVTATPTRSARGPWRLPPAGDRD